MDVDITVPGTFDTAEDQILMTYRHENETIVDGLKFVKDDGIEIDFFKFAGVRISYFWYF